MCIYLFIMFKYLFHPSGDNTISGVGGNSISTCSRSICFTLSIYDWDRNTLAPVYH